MLAATASGCQSAIQTPPIYHLDGNGPLASTDDPEARSGFAFLASDGGPFTVGAELCLTQGSGPAVLQAVWPAASVGSGLREVGAYIWVFPSHRGEELPIATDGFPPRAAERFQPVPGFVVRYACASAGEPGIYTALLLGLAKPTNSLGGGWNGIDVEYTVNGQRYVLLINRFIYTCGPLTPAEAQCSVAQGTPSPASAA